MQYRLIQTPNGERLWLPFLAGAAIISAPLWLNNKCCNNQQPQYVQPIYPYPYPQYYPYPYYNYSPNYSYPPVTNNINYN